MLSPSERADLHDTLASNVLLLRRQTYTLDELAAFKVVDLGHIKDSPAYTNLPARCETATPRS
jgi:hypothetical protein